VALQALKPAEAAETPRAQASTPPAHALPPARHAAFRARGQQLPELWPTDVLSQAPRKALWRCLLAKVVRQRARRAQMHTRLVGWGGATTTFEVPVAVGALTDLPTAPEMAQQMRGLFAEGKSDDEMARQLTQHGERSPRRPAVLPSPGQGIRLTRGLMQTRSPSPPRQSAGYLTGAQLAEALGVTPLWVYHPSQRGTGAITRDAATGLSLLPDAPETLEAWRQLRMGQRTARHS
jgi:hypothetical protein